MPQPLVRQLIGDLQSEMEFPEPIVEFGSLQYPEHGLEGDLRPLFEGRDFTGTDMTEGPGVDRVEDLRKLSFADGSVGTALCVDTLEHCADPPAACRELCRVTAPGGLCVITSVMLFGIHGYPNDYFRFTPEGFRAMLDGFDDVWVAGIGHPDIPRWVVGVGVKDRKLDLSLDKLPSLTLAQRLYDERRGKVRLGVNNHAPGELVRALLREAPRLARERIGRSR